MTYDVFLSYSKWNRSTAQEFKSRLSDKGFTCYIVPEDVIGGKLWEEEIRCTIRGSGAVVVLLSSTTNDTSYVAKELSNAIENGVTIIPYVIDKNLVDDSGHLVIPKLKGESEYDKISQYIHARQYIIPHYWSDQDEYSGISELCGALESCMGERQPKAHQSDGAEMIVIGADDENALSSYKIDIYAVTNAQYAKFLTQHTHTDRFINTWIKINDPYCLIKCVYDEKEGIVYRPESGKENHPVTLVSWHGAVAYAHMYGKRLPTSAEWEKAARGGLEGMDYPWGNEIDEGKANYDPGCYRGAECPTGAIMKEYLAPVGRHEPCHGLYNMVGNVWEWCLNSYLGYHGKSHVVRGGSWWNEPSRLRLDVVGNSRPMDMEYNNGFRCVRDVDT